jgi:hypothetical protein
LRERSGRGPLLQMDMNGLCVFAAGGGGAGDEIRLFGTDIDKAVTELHFGVAEVPFPCR